MTLCLEYCRLFSGNYVRSAVVDYSYNIQRRPQYYYPGQNWKSQKNLSLAMRVLEFAF